MDKTEFYKLLIQRYKNKTATDEEIEVFFQLIREGALEASLMDEMGIDLGDIVEKKPRARRIRPYYAAAAVLLIGLGIAYFLLDRPSTALTESSLPLAANDVPAGGNHATLTLPDGSRIALDDVGIGELVQEAGVRIAKTEDGQLVYQTTPYAATGADRGSEHALHEISTPRGGQYQVVLPDGSKVWLNAGSRLRFPAVFAAGSREVFLEGEGFFSVAHNDQRFIVRTDGQQITVLGTEFNVRAHPDEPMVQTTLLRGSVQVDLNNQGASHILKPNQQAVVDRQAQTVRIEEVVTSEYAAWKDGYFTFRNTPLATVMQDVARWYDVSIDAGSLPDKRLYAVLPRDVSLATLLEMIGLTSGIEFDLKEGRVSLER
ncbi:FecR family protein [Parapedobacter soli]|uniref:FecR family protein n=1 Tax=Parapedobacter soli TaxID=416955 RepID=UPI0021CA388F|nr:FecR domain-containing protein [Parapedobacter soli]